MNLYNLKHFHQITLLYVDDYTNNIYYLFSFLFYRNIEDLRLIIKLTCEVKHFTKIIRVFLSLSCKKLSSQSDFT